LSDKCIFCDIVTGKEPSFTVYEDELSKAFLDVHPVSKGHTLVIPKKHYEMIFDIPQDELVHLIKVTKNLCLHYRKKAGMESMNLVLSNGKAAHQDVAHFHFHILPRVENDRIVFWSREPRASKLELEKSRTKFATET